MLILEWNEKVFYWSYLSVSMTFSNLISIVSGYLYIHILDLTVHNSSVHLIKKKS